MGLDLFYPPNVAGWPGSRTWLTTRTVIARANYAAAVVSGEVYRPTDIPNLQELAKKHSASEGGRFEKMMRTLLLGGASEAQAKESTKPNADSREANIVLKLLTGTPAHIH